MTPKSSLGFSAVKFAEDVLGISLIPWQRWLLIHSLELRLDGRFRFRTVLVLVARQNGKTTLVEVKNLWKMFVLQVPLIIGTAQQLDISEESWDKAAEIVDSIPELAVEVAHVDRTNGKKALRLNNGSRWKIAAASRKGGRGLSGDDVNLDELREHHTWDSWAAVTKTTMAKRNPQVWAFSNAGDNRSIVLNDLQAKGRATVETPEVADSSLGLFEWSAPDDCPIDDPRFWAMANPSLGYTVTQEGLRSALGTDPEPVFRTECLCQRVPDLIERPFSVAAWDALADGESAADDPVAFAIDTTPDRAYTSIAAAGKRPDGRMHGEVIEHRQGTGWVVPRVVELVAKHSPCVVVLDPGSPAGAYIPDLEDAGVKVKPSEFDDAETLLDLVSVREHAQACSALANLVENDQLRHRAQVVLDDAVRGAQKRTVSDVWLWDRKSSAVDISPLVAVTLAAYGFAVHGDQDEGVQFW